MINNFVVDIILLLHCHHTKSSILLLQKYSDRTWGEKHVEKNRNIFSVKFLERLPLGEETG